MAINFLAINLHPDKLGLSLGVWLLEGTAREKSGENYFAVKHVL